ncbi:MAG TPA: hypothetical protein PK228_14795 [Saprospiraceae bacterium]|nr:hypothetical protein [Saprospiraceae bacterium]
MRYLATLLLCLAPFLDVSAQSTNQVVFSFTHKIGDDTLSLNKSFFTIWNGQLVKITRAQFYVSKIEIQQPGGGALPLTDRYLLVNAEDPNAEYDLGEWPVDAAQGVKMGLGVDADHNHLDPTVYPADHPLAPKNPSMHWGWAAGYTFMAIEGELDKNLDGTPETIFQFHSIDDMLYKTVELSGTATAQNGVLHLHFDLDYVKLFNDIPLVPSFIFHGSAVPNQQMMTNAANASFITMSTVSATHAVLQNSLAVSAAPNPASAETLIRYDIPGVSSLDLVLTNSLGQSVRVLNGLPAPGATSLLTAGLPAGTYQYAFYNNGVLMARKQLVVQH